MANLRPNFMAKRQFKTEDSSDSVLLTVAGQRGCRLRRSWHAGSPTVDVLTILRLSGMTYRVQESQWRLQSGSRALGERALQHSLVTMSAVCCASLCPLMALRWLPYDNNHSILFILLTCIHKSSVTIWQLMEQHPWEISGYKLSSVELRNSSVNSQFSQ